MLFEEEKRLRQVSVLHSNQVFAVQKSKNKCSLTDYFLEERISLTHGCLFPGLWARSVPPLMNFWAHGELIQHAGPGAPWGALSPAC